MENKLTSKQIVEIFTAIGTAVALVLLAFGFISGEPEANAPEARGVTNFDSLTLSDDLIVGDDATVTGDLAVTGALDTDGELNYGANNLSVLGYGSSGEQAVSGTDTMTTTLAVSHGLTTVTFCLATLGEDPETGAGDAAAVTTAVSANACTVKTWQDDFTAATEASVVVHWLVIGTP